VKKRESSISSARINFQNRFIDIANTLIQDFSKEKQQIVGEKRIQEEINRLLSEKDTYTENEAITHFEALWEQTEREITKQLRPLEDIIADSQE
jgi:uncharacterized protein YdaU (DUF1376 family)